jgi:hypothetical protein
MPILYPTPVILKCDKCQETENIIINYMRNDRSLDWKDLPKNWFCKFDLKDKNNRRISSLRLLSDEKVFCQKCFEKKKKIQVVKEIIE